MLRGQLDGTCEVYKRICFRTEKLEDNLRTHDSNFLSCVAAKMRVG